MPTGGTATMVTEDPLLRLRGGARSRSRSRSPRRQRGRSDRGRSRSRERTSDRRRSRSRSRQRRRSRSSSPRRDGAAAGKIKKASAKGRKYRNVKAGDESPDRAGAGEAGADPSKPDATADANEEDEEEEPGSWALAEAKRVEEEICKRVEAELASEGFQARVEAKLMEERAKLENKVTQQIAAERRGLLQKERKRIAEEMKHRRELATIMEENQRKVQDALKKAEVELAAEETPGSR